MQFDATALIQQTIENLGAIIPDARDKAEPCDHDSSHGAKSSRLIVLGEFKAHIIAQSRSFATRELLDFARVEKWK
jgi:hypothetical protein